MYLHLGENTVVMSEDIIGIFDLDNASRSMITRDYLTKAQKENRIINVSYELPKSFVVCMENMEENVYIVQLSSATICKRLKNIDL